MKKRWLRLGDIKTTFSVSGVVEKHIIRYLIEEGTLDNIDSKYCGHKIIIK